MYNLTNWSRYFPFTKSDNNKSKGMVGIGYILQIFPLPEEEASDEYVYSFIGGRLFDDLRHYNRTINLTPCCNNTSTMDERT